MLSFREFLTEQQVIFNQRSHKFHGNPPAFVRNNKTHAIKYRGKIWVGNIHADAVAEIIDYYGGQDETKRRAIAKELDNMDWTGDDFGYYYDGAFHKEPKHPDMVY